MTIAPTTTQRSRGRLRYLPLVLAGLLLIGVGLVGLARHDASSRAPTIEGSGVAASQVRVLPAFVAVELAGSNEVIVRVGGRQAVVVHADDNLLNRVTTRVEAGRLVIANTPGSFRTVEPMRVEIGVPSLAALTLSGSGDLSVTGVRTARLTVALDGSGNARVTGSTTRLDVTIAGSGDAQLEELIARDVHATLSGSGRILVTATGSLDASIPGSGEILYRGHPEKVTTSVTGSGAVTSG